MKSFLPRYGKALALLALLLPGVSFSETLAEFTTTCENALEIPPNSITGFDCSTGTVLPTTAFGSACDAKALLGPVGCAENSRLGVKSFSNPNVKAVWICRKYEAHDSPTDQRYHDIAMIVHNRQNGKTCFFQSNLDNTSNGPIVPAPRDPNALSLWKTPMATASDECTSCHSNDAYIVTPHVAPAMRSRGMIRFNPKGPYSVVGADFGTFNSAISRLEGCGGVCHFEPKSTFVIDSLSKGWMVPGTLPNYTAFNFNPIQGQFYSLSSNGQIWGFNGLDGGSCNGTSCPHWSMLDGNPSTASLAASGQQLYQLHNSG